MASEMCTAPSGTYHTFHHPSATFYRAPSWPFLDVVPRATRAGSRVRYFFQKNTYGGDPVDEHIALRIAAPVWDQSARLRAFRFRHGRNHSPVRQRHDQTCYAQSATFGRSLADITGPSFVITRYRPIVEVRFALALRCCFSKARGPNLLLRIASDRDVAVAKATPRANCLRLTSQLQSRAPAIVGGAFAHMSRRNLSR